MSTPKRPLTPADLDGIPRLGWVAEATPVTALPRAAKAHGLEFLGVKRDDLGPLHGGNKPHKLDYLLAAPPFTDAPAWAAAGGIGSGLVAALTEAARKLGRHVHAHLFWTQLSDGVRENLAFTASGPSTVHFYGSRTSIALRRPAVLVGSSVQGMPVVPPGGTSPRGMIGVVRAGLDLAAQVRAGELPEPERLYVALGSGGTAVGLALGLALGGLSTQVVAVAVVERLFATRGRVRSLERAVMEELGRFGIAAPDGPLPLSIDHAHVGAGYAQPSAEAIAAGEEVAAEGIALEPVYTGKAMAALLADARRHGVKRALFWCTVRGPLPAPDPAYQDKLPPALRRRLAPDYRPLVTRRRVVVSLAALAAAGVAARVTGYPTVEGFQGEVLSTWEARVLLAAAEALLPPAAQPPQIASIPARVDRYLAGMPAGVQREVHGMLALIEQGTTLLDRRISRFTRLTAGERVRFLDHLEARGGMLADASRGLRDLCMLAFYQQPEAWGAIGYDGPRVSLGYDPRGKGRMVWAAYESLVAPAGELPRSAR